MSDTLEQEIKALAFSLEQSGDIINAGNVMYVFETMQNQWETIKKQQEIINMLQAPQPKELINDICAHDWVDHPGGKFVKKCVICGSVMVHGIDPYE